MKDFEGASFTVIVDGKTYNPTVCTETYGENYPIRDNCTLKGDPSSGCLTTGAYYYRVIVPYPEGTSVSVSVFNGENTCIYNSTYGIQTSYISTWDEMGCDSEETCKPICDSWGGELKPSVTACFYYTYLNELCYRVRHQDTSYVIDHPPGYDLSAYTDFVGCECVKAI